MKTLLIMKYFFFRGIIFFTCLLLFQCQSIKNVNSSAHKEQKEFKSWNESSTALKKYNQWHAVGKIGFTFPYQGKRKAVSANIDWQQNFQDFDMVFSGPLGMGQFTIEKRPDETVLTNHQGQQYSALSPEALFNEHAGIQIPWSDLAWWVRALPAPKKAHEKQFMDDGLRVASIQQSGWTVDYLNYSSNQGSDSQIFNLPQKIKFSNGEIYATLIVREWVLIK